MPEKFPKVIYFEPSIDGDSLTDGTPYRTQKEVEENLGVTQSTTIGIYQLVDVVDVKPKPTEYDWKSKKEK